ncbi:MAG: LysM peptidoglycan-binding domain-containing protein [Desulfatibacillum sp.]|nr:LysM peptidoglycan-binding domain-containing protein [Desulfatibacillum sp.]
MHLNPMKFGVIAFLACVLAFAGQAFSQEDEGEYIGWSQGLKYTVQEGDTLWDLSEKFFDTPAMWPELWKQNPHIKNPHWIEPGTVINLFVEDGVAFIPKPEPPAPEPVEVVEVVVEEPPKPPVYYYPSIEKAGFVRKNLVESLGEIVDITENRFLASTGNTVYISLTKDYPYAEGDRFTLWRPLNKIKDNFNGKFRKREIGTQHLIVGEVLCTRLSNGSMRATVEETYRAIKIGDQLMSYRNLPSDIIILPGVPGMEGKIVAEENDREIFGAGDVVFINKGTDEGIAEGQEYSLFFDKELKAKRSENAVFSELAGKFIVLIAQDNNATALITESLETIRVGTIFRTQEMLER